MHACEESRAKVDATSFTLFSVRIFRLFSQGVALFLVCVESSIRTSTSTHKAVFEPRPEKIVQSLVSNFVNQLSCSAPVKRLTTQLISHSKDSIVIVCGLCRDMVLTAPQQISFIRACSEAQSSGESIDEKIIIFDQSETLTYKGI